VRCSDSRRAQRALRRVPGMDEAVSFGDHLHITVPRTGFDVEAGLAQLRTHGIDVHGWQMREPSLEDVFLSYIHRRAADPGAAAAADP
jgi:hypothetical protein